MRVSPLVVAAGFGWLAGMRNLAAPAAATFRIRRHRARYPLARLFGARGTLTQLLGSPLARAVIPTAAATEMGVVDKLGITPDRTFAPVLLLRIGSGALAGAAAVELGRRPRPSWLVGALVGGAAALVSSYANLGARRAISARLGVSEQKAGIAEDALALGLGAALARA